MNTGMQSMNAVAKLLSRYRISCIIGSGMGALPHRINRVCRMNECREMVMSSKPASSLSVTRALCAAIFAVALGTGTAAVAQTPSQILKNRSIGYVTSDLHWSAYQTADGKSECPDGMNELGPREVFKDMFPEGKAKYTVAETHLAREAAIWDPRGREDKYPYVEAGGKIATGLNLDGKTGPNDFTSPTGEKGIDNQLFRAIGCSRFYRGPDGTFYIFGAKYARDFDFNRTLIEITNVDDLANDADVDVAFYRGLDKLMTDASGNQIMPGGTQRIDGRFGKRFEAHLKGKIVDGVLTTQPSDVYVPWACFGRVPGGHHIKAMRSNLKLSPTEANGMMAGYSDAEEWYTHLVACQSTHHLSYGQLNALGLYRSLMHNADAYPGPDGQNTAISSSMDIRMSQVYVVHPEKEVAGVEAKPLRNATK
jgi:hypothetical protein